MAVYVSYSDESENNQKDGRFLVGGYVARESDWPDFARAWQERVLDGPSKIPYYHTTEMKSRKFREEHGLTYNDSERRIDEAVRVIFSMGPMSAFAGELNKDEFSRVFRDIPKNELKRLPKVYKDPDYFCFMAYIMMLVSFVKHRYNDVELINFVVEPKQAIPSAELQSVIDAVRLRFAHDDPEYAPLVGNIVQASLKDQIPLQAADALCWHMQRYHYHRLNPEKKNMDRSDESRMWYLLKERHGWSQMMEEELLRDMKSFADIKGNSLVAGNCDVP
jgi:Protein of unknown function (DUF3800)